MQQRWDRSGFFLTSTSASRTCQTGPGRSVDRYRWFSVSLAPKWWLTPFINFVSIRNIIAEICTSLLDYFHSFIEHYFSSDDLLVDREFHTNVEFYISLNLCLTIR